MRPSTADRRRVVRSQSLANAARAADLGVPGSASAPQLGGSTLVDPALAEVQAATAALAAATMPPTGPAPPAQPAPVVIRGGCFWRRGGDAATQRAGRVWCGAQPELFVVTPWA